MRNTGDLSWIVLHSEQEGIFIIMYIFRILMTEQRICIICNTARLSGTVLSRCGEISGQRILVLRHKNTIRRIIIVAPQLNDWGETSADQAIELT